MKHYILTLFQRIEGNGHPFRQHPQPLVARDSKGVYVRATNIRDAARILDSFEEKPKDWIVECVSAEEINEVRCSLAPFKDMF